MKIAKMHLTNWVDFATARGLSGSELASRFPYLLTADNETADNVTVDEFYTVLEYIDQQLSDELMGIKAGNFLRMQLLGLIFQLSMQTKNIGEALHYLSSYLDATFPIVQVQTVTDTDHLHLTVGIHERKERTDRLILEKIMTILYREISLMSAERVEFRITSPFYNNNYPEYWEPGNSFSISFPKIILKAQIQDRSTQQLDILLPKYLHLLAAYKQNAAFSGKVKLAMLALSDPSLPDVTEIPQHLYVTPRTLQRRLKYEGQSFRKLKEEVRKEIASSLLLHDEYPVNSLAHILGYADASSFIHSFKNWFGVAPGTVRASLQ